MSVEAIRAGRTTASRYLEAPNARILLYGAVGIGYLLSRLALVWRLPWHYDEATFAGWALDGFHDPTRRFDSLASGQQPLVEWLGMVGIRLGLEPVIALRFVSVLAGLVTLVLVALLARRLAGEPAGLAAAALYVILPFTLVYSVPGLYDPLAAMLVVAALLLQIEIAERPRLGLALLLGLVLAAGLLTKLTATIAVYLIPLSALAFDWRREGLGRRLAAWIGSLGIALVLAGLGSLILRLSDLYNDLQGARDTLNGNNSFAEAAQEPGSWLVDNGVGYSWALLVYLTPPILLAAVVGSVACLRRTPRRTLIVIGWAVLPFLAVIVLAVVPEIRWLFVAIPPLVALAGVGVVAICREAAAFGRSESTARRWAIVAGAVLVASALAFSARIVAAPTTSWYPGRDRYELTDGDPVRRGADAIRRAAPADGPVSVLLSGYGVEQPRLHLLDVTNLRLIVQGTGSADGSLLALQFGIPLEPRPSGLGWRETDRFPAAVGREPVVVYQAVALVGEKQASTTDELRALIGGSDRDYDAFVNAHPAVRAWVDAWARALGN